MSSEIQIKIGDRMTFSKDLIFVNLIDVGAAKTI
jgi:hypothetical protein